MIERSWHTPAADASPASLRLTAAKMCCIYLYPARVTPQNVVIVGVGAFAQGLASLAIRSGATASYDICLGSRKVSKGNSGVLPGLEDTPVRSLDDAVEEADTVSQAARAGGWDRLAGWQHTQRPAVDQRWLAADWQQ